MKINTSKLELLAARQGMNFKNLAFNAGVTPQTLSTIRGRKSCAAVTAFKLATALGVDVVEIIEQEAAQ